MDPWPLLGPLFSNLGPSRRTEVHWTYHPQKMRGENRDKIQDRRDDQACIHPVATNHPIWRTPLDEVTNLEYGNHSTIIGKDPRPQRLFSTSTTSPASPASSKSVEGKIFPPNRHPRMRLQLPQLTTPISDLTP